MNVNTEKGNLADSIEEAIIKIEQPPSKNNPQKVSTNPTHSHTPSTTSTVSHLNTHSSTHSTSTSTSTSPPSMKLHFINDPSFSNDFLMLEAKHSQVNPVFFFRPKFFAQHFYHKKFHPLFSTRKILRRMLTLLFFKSMFQQ